jgi:multidrug efflux pump subunit AcrB
LGLFATQTNRGDIQVVLRPAENDLLRIFNRPVRPPFEEVEKEIEATGKELAIQKYGKHATPEQIWAEGKAAVQQKYRRRPLPKIMDEIEHEIKEHFHEHQLKFELIQIMADELNDLSGANKPLEIKVFGPDQEVLRHEAIEIAEMLEKKGKGRGFKEPNTDVAGSNPDLRLQVKETEAARIGITAQDVERQLRAMYQGQIATQVKESDVRITDVRVRYPDILRFGTGLFRPRSVLDQLVLLPEGKGTKEPWKQAVLKGPARAVPLAMLADIKLVRTAEKHYRENQQPVAIVTSEQNEAEAGLGAMVADVRNWMKDFHLPSGYRWELGGHYLRQQEAFLNFVVIFVVAFFLVYIMLAFQFRSLVLPLLIFLTQPLSIFSGFFALWLTNTPLNVSSAMGMILLVGLDMKNGIILVEYIQQLLGQGTPLREALIIAGRTRFRPILMTSLAAILGLLPLALGLGPGAQMQQPLAITVIGGLTANMLFTRLIIPAGYLIVGGRQTVRRGVAG